MEIYVMETSITWEWGRWLIGIYSNSYGFSIYIGPLEFTIFKTKLGDL